QAGAQGGACDAGGERADQDASARGMSVASRRTPPDRPRVAPESRGSAAPRRGSGEPAVLATYRIQLTPEFGFDQLRSRLPYLARLGVSHVYLSPCLEAVSGSAHGYDV